MEFRMESLATAREGVIIADNQENTQQQGAQTTAHFIAKSNGAAGHSYQLPIIFPFVVVHRHGGQYAVEAHEGNLD